MVYLIDPFILNYYRQSIVSHYFLSFLFYPSVKTEISNLNLSISFEISLCFEASPYSIYRCYSFLCFLDRLCWFEFFAKLELSPLYPSGLFPLEVWIPNSHPEIVFLLFTTFPSCLLLFLHGMMICKFNRHNLFPFSFDHSGLGPLMEVFIEK